MPGTASTSQEQKEAWERWWNHVHAEVRSIGRSDLAEDETIRALLTDANTALNSLTLERLIRFNVYEEQGEIESDDDQSFYSMEVDAAGEETNVAEPEEGEREDEEDEAEVEDEEEEYEVDEEEDEDDEEESEKEEADDEDEEMAEATGDQYACQWRNCTQVKNTADELLHHVDDDHIGRIKTHGVVQLTCAWGSCVRSHKRRALIKSHIITHIPTRQTCDKCGAVFTHPRSKIRHDQMLHPDRTSRAGRSRARSVAKCKGKGRVSRVQGSRVQKTQTAGRGRMAGRSRR